MKYLLYLHEGVFVTSTHAKEEINLPRSNLIDRSECQINVFDQRSVAGLSMRLCYSINCNSIFLLLLSDKVCADLDKHNSREHVRNFGSDSTIGLSLRWYWLGSVGCSFRICSLGWTSTVVNFFWLWNRSVLFSLDVCHNITNYQSQS